jgi:hypothetical protein
MKLLLNTRLKLCTADGGYESRSSIFAITGRGAISIISLNPGNEKAPPVITNTLGTPLGPIGLPMLFWGRDGHYLKYRCPEQSGLFCCRIEHEAITRCSTSDWIKADWALSCSPFCEVEPQIRAVLASLGALEQIL